MSTTVDPKLTPEHRALLEAEWDKVKDQWTQGLLYFTPLDPVPVGTFVTSFDPDLKKFRKLEVLGRVDPTPIKKSHCSTCSCTEILAAARNGFWLLRDHTRNYSLRDGTVVPVAEYPPRLRPWRAEDEQREEQKSEVRVQTGMGDYFYL